MCFFISNDKFAKIELLLFSMKLITEVHIPPLKSKLTYNDSLLFVGSCFADNIGAKFKAHKFTAQVNPYGVLYNPLSVLQMLKHASDSEELKPEDIILHNGLWHSFAHHGSFSKENKSDLEEKISHQKEILKKRFDKTDYLFITWGTAWVYKYAESNRVVANCHKIPAKRFERFRLSTQKIVADYSKWISGIKSDYPNLKIVLTVSPVRHLKDTAHGNQLSKSVLLLAAENLCNRYDHVSYFPSYEIILDELRDYRFYAEDLTHPNELAIQYIWEKMKNNFLDNDAVKLLPEIRSLMNAANHRPLKKDTPEHQKFIKSTISKIEALRRNKTMLDFSVELEILEKQLL